MNTILKRTELVPKIFELVVEAPRVAKKALPGHFVVVMAEEAGERIPLTIADFDRQAGTVTPFNACPLSDGAAAVVVMSRAKADELGLEPMARWLGSAVAGVDPGVMGYGPVPATEKLLARLGLGVDDIGLVELNEAFAAQALGVMKRLGLRHEITNVNGGAIALGHPLGATGAVILGTLLDEIERRDVGSGLATLCVGGGMGTATIIERV